jgi:hypothetical protein
MRREERLTLKLVLGGGLAVALVPVLYLTGLFLWGRSLTPPPTAETTPAPSMIKDALWARANGGRAAELRAMNPITVAGWIACTEIGKDVTDSRARISRDVECADWLPAIQASSTCRPCTWRITAYGEPRSAAALAPSRPRSG